ncbi:MAG: DUF4131 domain-containing protein, partial [bacterium]
MSRAKLFLGCCLGFIAGIGLASLLPPLIFPAYLFLLSCLVVLVLGWTNKKIRVLAVIGLFLGLGFWRFNLARPAVDAGQIAFYQGRTLVFQGLVVAEPDQRLDHVKLTIGQIQLLANGESKEIKGRALIKTNLYPSYRYGDKLKIYGQLREPGQF